jgi:hypothetical protein
MTGRQCGSLQGPAPAADDVFHYDQMLGRLIHLYEMWFGGLT